MNATKYLRGPGRLLLGLVVLGMAAPPSPAAGSKPRWRAGVEAEAAPFTFADERGRPAGFAVELLQAVAADQQLDIDYVVLPWGELLERYRTGDIDIICNIVDTPERAKSMAFSSTTAVLRGAMFHHRDHPPIESLAELRGLKVAVPAQSRAHEYLRQKDWGVEFVFFPSLLACVRAVNDGQADAVFATELVTKHLASQHRLKEIVAAPLEFPDFSYREHFAVAPANTALLAQLNEGLLAIERSGLYSQIYERWVGSLGPRRLRWADLRPYAVPLGAVVVLIVAVVALQRWMLARVSSHARALRESEERLSLVLEGSQDGFWDWDIRTGHVLRSPRWFSMLGYEPAEIPPGREGFLDLIHPEDRPRIVGDETRIWREHDRFELEFRMRARNGEWKWILDRGKVVARDPATREPLRITGTHTDITPRKRAEEESALLHRRMQETQRLESLGVLAGGIAHDFNNLLTVILGNASLVRLDDRSQPETLGRIEKITTAANRAADLCRQLLAYAGKGAFTLELVQLDQVVRDTTHLLELSLHPRGKLEFEFARDLPAVEADPSQMQQIVMNLVLNASEALGETGGRIRLLTQRVELVRGELLDALPAGDLPSGLYACLEVSDNGGGMTPEVRARIFDPFFTTKFTGRGLGLAAVLGIVRSHRGALTVRSRPGEGTTFRIYLPAATTGTVPVPAESAAAARRGAPGTYLVVDDEPTVRSLLGDMLRQLGHDAVSAPDGRSAVTLFAAAPAQYTAALIDLTMPGLDGHATLLALRGHRPDLPCILLSGYSESEARSRPNAGAFTAFLQKPFTPESLNACLLRASKGT